MDTPAAEIVIDEPLVKRLLRAQHPDLADQSLRFVASGWDNAIYRLGEKLAVRLPRRTLAVGLIAKEQRWLPEFASRLSTAIPTPLRIGVPSADFPWPWSVTPWLDGDLAQFDAAGTLVSDLARFIRELHVEAPAFAPKNPVRGGPLADRTEVILERLRSEPIPRRSEVTELWQLSAATNPWDHAGVWLHGDLHPSNILTASGRLAAVIDFGDLTAGDPATDLAIAWLLFDHAGRERFRAELDYDDNTWQRSKGWAIIFASLAIGGDVAFRRFAEDAFREVLVSES
jgi:aminoglycoside phosphotransferase (APT) family kinase protein